VARRKVKAEALLIGLPMEDVNVLLEVLEDYIESIQDADCDCDNCDRELDVLGRFRDSILSVQQVKQTKGD